MSTSPEFLKRFKKQEDELKWLYMELYHGDEKAYKYLTAMLENAYNARPESLKKLDRVREADPAWYKGHDLIGMLMYVNAFGGNLKGVREKLPYLEEAGINYLHLMPLLDTTDGKSDGGYAVSNFRKVKENLGTLEDLFDLSEECHANGIAVCLDFVMNHTSEDHEWAVRAKAGDKTAQDRYFFFDDWKIPYQFELTVPQVFPTTAPGNFTWCEEAGKVVMTTFYPYQWDLNYRNPMVFNDMTDNLLFLCNQGVDIIRLDAVPYIWKKLGTNCRNLPEVHSLVRMMRIICEIVCPGTLLLGEVVMEPKEVVPYFGSVAKPECHLLYNVTTMATTWHTVATKDTRLMRHQLEQVFSLPKEYSFLNYLRCHDDIGWGLDYKFLVRFGEEESEHKKFLNDYLTGKWKGSPARGELYNDDPRLKDARLCGTTASLCGIEVARREGNEEMLTWAVRLDLMLHAFMLSLSGIPVLYSGDEVARENDYTYHMDILKREDSRFLHRGDMLWDQAEKRSEEGTVENEIFYGLRMLEEARGTHRAFDGAADTWVLPIPDNGVLGFGRYYKGEKLLCLYNFAEGERHVNLYYELGDYKDLLTGEELNKADFVLPSGGFVWAVCDFDE